MSVIPAKGWGLAPAVARSGASLARAISAPWRRVNGYRRALMPLGHGAIPPYALSHYDASMTALPKTRMTVDEFLAWAEGQPGRYELHNGVVYAMTPERARHAETKFAIQKALDAAIRRAGVPCRMLPDGMTVRIDEATAHEPDALVYCGEKLAPTSIEVPHPVVVVEVLSPSTRHIDASAKLAGYFRLPSVMHYLIVDPDGPPVIHHARGSADMILTRIVGEGSIRLDPPGIELALAAMFEEQA
jgi:Uma2 family endonuclease